MTEIQKAVTVALLAFSENFRQAVTEDLTSVWMNTLGELSMDAIKTGTRRCLTECEFFPSLSVFITKTKKTDMLRPSTWEDATVAKLIREATKAKIPFVPFRTVHGTENGLNFTIKQDAEGRDIVEYTNRPEPTATYMRY